MWLGFCCHGICTDWLIDRRHCEAKWVGQVKLVQERIGRAVKDVADNNEISKVLETSRKLLFLYFYWVSVDPQLLFVARSYTAHCMVGYNL